MAVNLSQIQALLTPGLHAVTGKYEMIPTQFSQIFDRKSSNFAVERSVEARMLGLAALKTEGGAIQFDNQAGVRFTYNQEHIEIALGFAVTQKAIEDNLYKSEFPTSALAMRDSFMQTKEINAAAVLNTAGVFNPNIGGDGVALCATNHPIDGATWANRPSVDVDLGESTLLAAQNAIRQNFKNLAGLKVMARAKKLIIHPSNEPVAIRLLKTELRPGTSDNDVNAIKSVAGGIPDGYQVMDFLTSPFAWFLKTSIPGLIWFDRVKYSTDMQTDFITNNLLVKGRERYSFGWNNPRAIFGSFPTS